MHDRMHHDAKGVRLGRVEGRQRAFRESSRRGNAAAKPRPTVLADDGRAEAPDHDIRARALTADCGQGAVAMVSLHVGRGE